MQQPRRDAGRPRGHVIEEGILSATLCELAEFGVDGFSVARVAAAAEVNKTSVYRRWPTREALIAAALGRVLEQTADSLPDTGSLRGDLSVLLAQVAGRFSSPQGRALAVAALSESLSPAVRSLAAEPRVREQAAIIALIQRAVARGEWDVARHAPEPVLALLTGSVMHRVLLERGEITPEWAEAVVDVVVAGLGAGAKRN